MRRTLKLLVLFIAFVAFAPPVSAKDNSSADVGESPAWSTDTTPWPAYKPSPSAVDEAPKSNQDETPAPAPVEDSGKNKMPPAGAANEAAYTVIAGDVLQITVWKEDSLDREVLVLPDGTISFPLIGSFSVQGMTPAQIQSTIKSKLHAFIPDASVAVMVKADLGHTVSVIGQVNKPGEIMMGRRLTVMEALSQAGGLTPFANEGRIIILRHQGGKEISIPFPYSDVIEGDELDKDIVLNPGDVVVVPTAGLL